MTIEVNNYSQIEKSIELVNKLLEGYEKFKDDKTIEEILSLYYKNISPNRLSYLVY